MKEFVIMLVTFIVTLSVSIALITRNPVFSFLTAFYLFMCGMAFVLCIFLLVIYLHSRQQ